MSASIPSGSNLYSQSFGATSSSSFPGNAIRATRPPADSDVRGPQGNFTIGQLWVDTVDESAYQLANITASNGVISGSWIVLGGGSSALAQLSGDSGTAFPVGGNINIVGGAGVVTSGSGANITIALTGGGEAVDSFIPNSGTSPVFPATNGSVTWQGTGSITTVGGTNSVTPQLTGLTSHNVLIGAGTATITKVAPGTAGIPLVSAGSTSDPAFSTALVVGGGTGLTSATAYSPIVGGTTTTGAFQSASTGQATTGFVLTSTGASSVPTWQLPPGTALVTNGSWVPTLKFGGASTGITYVSNTAHYVAVGTPGTGNALVTISGIIELISKGSATGTATISGVPYATTLDQTYGVTDLENITPGVGFSGCVCQLSSGLPDLNLITQPSGAGSIDAALTDTNFANNSNIAFTISYQA